MPPLCAFLLVSPTGCVRSTKLVLPEVPTALRTCAQKLVPDLPGSSGQPLTKTDIVQGLADQRSAAFEKDRCSKDAVSFYDDVKKMESAK